MSYLWTTLKVKNLEESIKFYENIVGLELQRKFKADTGREIAFMAENSNATAVELVEEGEKGNIEIGNDISLGFEIDSVKEKIDFVKEKEIKIHSGPFSPNNHIEFFYILDPNGVKIQFVENK